MIGDPSGRSEERNLLDADQLAKNLAAISLQIARVLGPGDRWELVDNATWTAPITFLDFLRDVGKHAPVNQMIARESVQSRMSGDAGISFTEFSYQLLQAHDFWWLRTHRDCELQVGGSDQWGNIAAGIDLVRRRGAGPVHGLTWPLLLRADGSKFGKSASGENVWLDPVRTSPYRFFQFWMQTDDADVERLLLQMTLLPLEQVREIVATHATAPPRRSAQRALARAVTAQVHGEEAANQADAASTVLFGGAARDAGEAVLAVLVDEVPTLRVPRDEIAAGVEPVELLLRSGLCASKAEARRTLSQGGGYSNDDRLAEDARLGPADLLHDRYLLLRRGRKAYALVVVDDG